MERIQALELISSQLPDDPLVFTCGSTCREMVAADRRENHLYVVDSMGLVPSIVLGLSLGLKDNSRRRVVGVEGDGGMLANLNALATIGYLQPRNLLLIVLDNQSYASTGGQPTFTTNLDLADIAAACKLRTWKADDLESLKQAITESADSPGPAFVHMAIAPGNAKVPLLLEDPVTLGDRFNRWLSSSMEI
ncbi:MAG: hypothetical protein BZY88_18645 [SAR202 cluster bacterium Io17-Chloro-G9]|nr:MAG: hypothetical protein BZY88_18645 [SAR202 cluster bacterium Io17-Chloro-G9]